MKKALIVIDLQNDYFCGGNMELVNIDEALNKTNTLIQYARKQRYKIFIVHSLCVFHLFSWHSTLPLVLVNFYR